MESNKSRCLPILPGEIRATKSTHTHTLIRSHFFDNIVACNDTHKGNQRQNVSRSSQTPN